MHQTLYIDIDEEITSIVERLRHSKAHEIIMVVPKRALLIQSIVNLRLLKKEAENLSLQLMIVTQDKLGKILVEKAGILVQQKLDDSLGEDLEAMDADSDYYKTPSQELAYSETESLDSRNKGEDRLTKIGSDNFFDERKINFSAPPTPATIKPKVEETEEKLINKELVTGVSMDVKTRSNKLDMVRSYVPLPANPAPDTAKIKLEMNNNNLSADDWQDPQKRKLEKFFYSHSQDSSLGKPDNDNFWNQETSLSTSQSNKGKKLILLLAVVLILALSGGALYFFLPKAVIALTIKVKSKAQDCEVMGSTTATAIDYEKGIIPAKLLSITEEISRDFTTTGSKSLSNQKAHGKITIYNEYNSSSQPLVATTRFMTEDGKIFRLVKGVTVPGMNGGESGKIEAEVVADQAGDDYNINPTKFSIPGFKDSGSEKYAKFYGQSSSPMTGGGKGDGSSDTKAISDTDIANAKNSLVKDIDAALLQKVKDSAGEGVVVLEESINKEEPTYKLSNVTGEVADSFNVTLSQKVEVLVFKEDDLRSLVNSIIARSGGGKVKMDGSSLSLEYGKLEPDFKTGILNIKVHGDGQINPDINMDEFKKNILGKTNEEFETFLDQYSDIQKAEITYWPPFISGHIPQYEKRVDIQMTIVPEKQ